MVNNYCLEDTKSGGPCNLYYICKTDEKLNARTYQSISKRVH